MLKRIIEIIKFLRGDFIVLKIEHNTLRVDAEHFEKEKLKEVASTFFHHVYNL